MRAKRRTLLVLLGLIVLAGAALALLTWYDRREEQAASAAEEGTIPLSSFAVEDLTAIEYTWQGETVSLAYDGETWTLTDDPDYHLDQTKCNTMAAALADLKAKRRLDPQPGEDYGFAVPLLTVTVTAAGQSSTFTFGDTNTVTGDVYLQKAGEEAVYTAASAKAGCFEYGKAGLFEPFNPAGITASRLERIEYTRSGGDAAVCLQAVSVPDEDAADSGTSYTTAWRLEDEPGTALDEEKIDALLSALSGYVTGQITRADPSGYGFDQPLVTVHASDGEKDYTLTYASGTDGYYLMVEGDDSIYTVDGTVPAAFIPAEDWKE